MRTDAAVHRITRTDNGYAVESGAGVHTATAVVIAIPPAHRGAITFEPALPAGHAELIPNWPQGNLSKAYAAYSTPFWRAEGFSGEALSDEGPVFITFDVSPSDAGPGVLLGFTDARTFDPLPDEQRREVALAGFSGSLVSMYLRTPGMTEEDGVRPTQEGTEIEVTGSGGDIQVNETVKVVCGGIQAQNARIYIVDAVLNPADAPAPIAWATYAGRRYAEELDEAEASPDHAATGEHLVPFVTALVPVVDPAGGFVEVVDLPGLFEETP